MHVLVLVLLGFHALSAAFWASTTIVLGRGDAPPSRSWLVFRPG
jgi:hypothetical protein